MRTRNFCSYVHSMNRTYANLRNDRKIKFRMVSVQHFINEARDCDMSIEVDGDSDRFWVYFSQKAIICFQKTL